MDGYGVLRIALGGPRRQWYAHRAAWTLSFGAVPAGLFVCHRCDNPGCVRPAHLFLGDAKANYRDAMAKGRMRWHRGKVTGTTSRARRRAAARTR